MSLPWSWPWSRHFPARVLLKHNPKWPVIVELNFRFPCHSVDGKHLTRFPSETTTALPRSVEAAIMCYRAKQLAATINYSSPSNRPYWDYNGLPGHIMWFIPEETFINQMVTFTNRHFPTPSLVGHARPWGGANQIESNIAAELDNVGKGCNSSKRRTIGRRGQSTAVNRYKRSRKFMKILRDCT